MELETKRFYRFLAPRPTAIITTIDEEKKINAAPFSFIMPVSMNPPLLAVAIGNKRDILTNIRDSREFVVNIPPEEMLSELWACSKRQFRSDEDLEAVGLMTVDSEKVLAPCIRECIIWFECLLENEMEMGDHILVIGRVVHAEVKDSIVGKEGNIDLKKAKVLMHISGPKFTVARKEITAKEK